MFRIGAINWDAALPETTSFGYYASRSLSNRKYRSRTPYYAETDGDKVRFNYKTQEEYDRELQYAIDAGVDYFAYTWYSSIPAPEVKDAADPSNLADNHVFELTYARKMHLSSTLKEKIGLCAILVCMHPFSEADYAELADAMKMPCYEKIGGRPLVYLFGGYRTDFIQNLRAFPERYGTKDPFIVFFNNGVESPDGDYSACDGVSAYASCYDGFDQYERFVDGVLKDNEDRKKYGVGQIPFFSLGWNPAPRVEHPVPWCGYRDTVYPKTPDREELAKGGKRLAEWIKENRTALCAEHILSFAWNEFEEGGYICPTFGEGEKIDQTHFFGFNDCVKLWKKL